MDVYCSLVHSTDDADLRLLTVGGIVWMALDEVMAGWAVGGMEGEGLVADISVVVCVVDVGAGAQRCGLDEGGVCGEVIGGWKFWAHLRAAGKGKGDEEHRI